MTKTTLNDFGLKQAKPSVSSPTLLPGTVEDFDVFQLDADASPQVHGLRGVVFVTPLDGAIGMGSTEDTDIG